MLTTRRFAPLLAGGEPTGVALVPDLDWVMAGVPDRFASGMAALDFTPV
jgi:hypothetical protein